MSIMTPPSDDPDDKYAPVPIATILRAIKAIESGELDPDDQVCAKCSVLLPPGQYLHCTSCEKKILQDERYEALKARWNAMIPKRFQWASFDSELLRKRCRATSKQIAEFRAYGGTTTLLRGLSGTGKTSLAIAKLREVMSEAKHAIALERWWIYKRGFRARFVTAFDLARAYQEHGLGEGSPALVSGALQASVLVLDELGMELDIYKSSAAVIREVLHTRHTDNRPTILTSYLTRAQIDQHYGAGITRRLEEGLVVNLGDGK